MPRIVMSDPYDSTIEIWGNPQLDTSPILNECKKRACPDKMLEAIQQPFTCDYEMPIPEGCRNVIGNFDLAHYDKSFDQVETIVGTITLKSSNVTSFPKMKKLKAIRQKEKGPIIVIEDNPNLRDVKSLYSLNLYTKNDDGAVRVEKNSKLCVSFAEMDEMFVLQYLGTVDRCSKFVSPFLEKSCLFVLEISAQLQSKKVKNWDQRRFF
ncbi:receptor L domain protein [Teladorsagia circumcincta]|uniref:Receptor L domain protein n=1 Tax=Teladorsagia circumcincta TaxID=45464 RepID=A0A2G9TWZ8_TELCI|nr:receptor L domain protein [Teladorsagia circumcincta]